MPLVAEMTREIAGAVDPKRARELSNGARVIALDPGDFGMVASRSTSGKVIFCPPLLWEDIIERQVDRELPVVLLVEDQFLKLNPATSQELTWQSAALAGFLSALVPRLGIVHVSPRTWQSEQMRRMKIPLRAQLNRKDGIKLALQELREKIPAVTLAAMDQKWIEGCASALGILLWWEALCTR